MKYQVIIQRAVLKAIDKFERRAQKNIFAAIDKLSENPRPFGYKKW